MLIYTFGLKIRLTTHDWSTCKALSFRLLCYIRFVYFFRSPSPHKCLLETSFCGSKPTLADNLIEPSKPETDDLEKILLKREADTTKALIPESIKVPMVGGNLKPDPLDKPRRRGREERKEIFKREVEITKRFLEKANIEVGLPVRQVVILSIAWLSVEQYQNGFYSNFINFIRI